MLSYACYFPTVQRHSGTHRERVVGKYKVLLQRRYLHVQRSICTSTHLLGCLGIVTAFFISLSTAVVIGANILATF